MLSRKLWETLYFSIPGAVEDPPEGHSWRKLYHHFMALHEQHTLPQHMAKFLKKVPTAFAYAVSTVTKQCTYVFGKFQGKKFYLDGVSSINEPIEIQYTMQEPITCLNVIASNGYFLVLVGTKKGLHTYKLTFEGKDEPIHCILKSSGVQDIACCHSLVGIASSNVVSIYRMKGRELEDFKTITVKSDIMAIALSDELLCCHCDGGALYTIPLQKCTDFGHVVHPQGKLLCCMNELGGPHVFSPLDLKISHNFREIHKKVWGFAFSDSL